MQIGQLKRTSVLAALSECDRLGRSEFLHRYGFKEARQYFLLYEGRHYDSKAIAGVAYQIQTGQLTSSGHFTGGLSVANMLVDLGFTVTRSADWSWPELVLACDILHLQGWERTVRADEASVGRLSSFLRALDPGLAVSPQYRSTNSVQHKLEDMRTVHPSYRGRPTRGGALTGQVVDAYLANPDLMHHLAQTLWSDPKLVATAPDDVETKLDTSDLADVDAVNIASAFEGAVMQRWASHRERNPRLRSAKIEQERDANGAVACHVCSFNFSTFYPNHGEDYIEVHHQVPLHISGEVETKLDDLTLLCANCHRMIHRRKTWKTVAELRQIVEVGRNLCPPDAAR